MENIINVAAAISSLKLTRLNVRLVHFKDEITARQTPELINGIRDKVTTVEGSVPEYGHQPSPEHHILVPWGTILAPFGYPGAPFWEPMAQFWWPGDSHGPPMGHLGVQTRIP